MPSSRYPTKGSQNRAYDAQAPSVCGHGVGSAVLTEYKVRITTGTRAYAGTDADVYITLYGDGGQCGETELDLSWVDDFEAGRCVSFSSFIELRILTF